MTNKVLNKRENYRLFQAGRWGNKLMDWRSFNEYQHSNFRGLVSLRTLMGGNGPCRMNLDPVDAYLTWREWIDAKVPDSVIVVGEMATDDNIEIQGEYLNDISLGSHNQLLYSVVPLPMRQALKARSQTAHGLRADLLLKSFMTQASYEDWRELTDSYPGHVLEVSVYDRCLGNLPHRNAIVWEVRMY